ncbi:MAG: SMP-30/gluconolactonase/LRE family protein [Thermoleophilaceae bacterium]
MAEVRELASGLEFPEGPVVMPDGSVAVCEIKGGRITRVGPDGTKDVIAQPGGGPNGAQLGPDGKLYVCNNGAAYEFVDMGGLTVTHQPPSGHQGGRIERIDIDSGDVDVLYEEADGHPLIAPNDLVFDGHGGFWFTDHGIRHERTQDRTWIRYAKADGSEIREVMGPVDGANGIGLSPDGTKLYVAETYTAAIWSWDVTGPGEVGEPFPLLPHGGMPVARVAGFCALDSLAIDGEGNICVGTLLKGGITTIAPGTEPGGGQEIDFVEAGDLWPTNIAFGGEDLRTAYIAGSTTGRLLVTEWARPGLKLAHQA